jgi:hypothetical protein
MTIDLDESKIRRNEFGLWAGWLLATVGGMLIGFLPAKLIADIFGLGVAYIIVPLLAGALIGFLQWLALRRFIVGSMDWILTAGAGWAIGYAAGLLVIQVLGRQPGFAGFWLLLACYALFGVIIALVQWPVLRREIPHAGPWILANVVGWALGFSIATAVELAVYSQSPAEPWIVNLIVQGISGLIAGAIIGLALVWIVRKPDIALVTSEDELPGTKGSYQAPEPRQ